jgi:hypothetical protein
MKELKFTLKVWQTAALLSPVLITLYTSVTKFRSSFLQLTSPDEVISFCFFGYIFGSLFTIPCALILWLVTLLANKYIMMGVVSGKMLLSLIGFMLALAPFILLGMMNTNEIYVPLCYAGVIIAGIWLYSLSDDTEEFSLLHRLHRICGRESCADRKHERV